MRLSTARGAVLELSGEAVGRMEIYRAAAAGSETEREWLAMWTGVLDEQQRL
jgi:hypothetical protein